jgi:hypothetical protein
MKTRITLTIIFLAWNYHLIAQNSACDRIFNIYAGTKGFTTLNISGNLLDEILGDEITKSDCSISSVKILVADDSNNQNFNFYKEIVPNLDRKEYEELMTVKNSGNDFIILCKKDRQRITELIMVSGGDNNSLIYVKGSISLSDARKISQKMSGGDNF